MLQALPKLVGLRKPISRRAGGSHRWASKPRAAGTAAPWPQLVQAVPGQREEGGA